MKTWVSICAIVLAAGVMTVLADPTASTPVNTNEVAIPPPATGPATPAPAKVTSPPRAAVAATPAPESAGNSHKGALTNAPSPAAAEEVMPPEQESLPSTNAVPAEGEGNAAPPANAVPPAESFGIGHLSALLIGAAILLVGGGVGFFIWSRSGIIPHGSLITSAMNELKKHAKSEDKDEEKPVAKPVEKREEKKMEIKFPPPMT